MFTTRAKVENNPHINNLFRLILLYNIFYPPFRFTFHLFCIHLQYRFAKGAKFKENMKRDELVFNLIEEEHQRQLKGIELIASENFVSDQVMQAMGSCMTNKYAEGYPGRRYYGGCEVVDKSEQLAIERLKELFGAEWANVQPHSGAQVPGSGSER